MSLQPFVLKGYTYSSSFFTHFALIYTPSRVKMYTNSLKYND
ncbi:hypothetical protein PROSTU_02284 [Providencia stuartii ATCC 25827]|uniref:Uncharacterized protein n=1 Tax=Providencia stuartii ATCC 25827 TaxID=471874 RepID=A0AA87CQI7_PROST|nr:hypothetical protein PROSTU_02284 [Providencia stuartii ATCC 25827]